MKNPEQSVLDKFHIKKLPSLYIMENDLDGEDDKDKKKKEEQEVPEGRVSMNLKLAQYTGKFSYDELSRYLRMFSKQQKPAEETQRNVEEEKRSIEVSSQKSFKKHCEENCYVLLVDGRSSKK
jgi:hypothetical protein